MIMSNIDRNAGIAQEHRLANICDQTALTPQISFNRSSGRVRAPCRMPARVQKTLDTSTVRRGNCL
jgi:hypothetical protein